MTRTTDTGHGAKWAQQSLADLGITADVIPGNEGEAPIALDATSFEYLPPAVADRRKAPTPTKAPTRRAAYGFMRILGLAAVFAFFLAVAFDYFLGVI